MEAFSRYSSERFVFPSSNIDPKDKLTPKYARKMGEAILSTYVGDGCAVPYSLVNDFDRIRAYAEGKQDVNKYKEIFKGKKNSNSPSEYDRRGEGNINWDIAAIAPRITDALLGNLAEIDYEVVADLIDPDSVYEQEQKASEAYAIGQHYEQIKRIKQNAGIPAESPTLYPTDLDELELMKDMGDFKSSVASALEKLNKHTFEVSDWDYIRVKLIKDIRDFNACAIREVFDHTEDKYKVEYVDVTRLIVQYSDKRDCNDSCYWGHIQFIPISDIRQRLEAAGYTQEEIQQVGKLWSQYPGTGNPPLNEWDKYLNLDRYGNWLYDFYKVGVLSFHWIENDNEKYIENKDRYGKRTIFSQDKWAKNKNTDNNKTVVTTVKRMYQANWLIGTNMVYDVKLSPSQPVNASSKKPISPYHIYVGNEQALTPRLVPVYDLFQNTWLKFQKRLQQLHDEIFLVDLSMIDKIDIKGKKMDFLGLIDLMKRTGVFPYRSLGFRGRYEGGNVKPIEKIPSTTLNAINECMQSFNQCISMVEMLTGFNPIALGQQPSNSSQVGSNEIAMQATSKILKPIVANILFLKEKSSEFLAEAIRLGVRNDKKVYSSYARIIGKNDIEALVDSEYEAREIGIKMIPRPTTQDRQMLLQEIERAAAPGKNGSPLLRFDIKFYLIEKLLNGGNLRQIRRYLTNAINKEQARQDALQQQNMQYQGQINQQNAEAKTQGEAGKLQLKTQGQLLIEDKKQEGKMEQLGRAQEHEAYMREKEAEQKPQR